MSIFRARHRKSKSKTKVQLAVFKQCRYELYKLILLKFYSALNQNTYHLKFFCFLSLPPHSQGCNKIATRMSQTLAVYLLVVKYLQDHR